jgi:hypothetical protein
MTQALAQLVLVIIEAVGNIVDEKLNSYKTDVSASLVSIVKTQEHDGEQLRELAVDLEAVQQAAGTVTRNHEQRIKTLEDNATNGDNDIMTRLAQLVAQVMNTSTTTTERRATGTRVKPVLYQDAETTRRITWELIPENGTWVTAPQLASRRHKRGSRPWEYWRACHSRNMLQAYRQGNLQRRKAGQQLEYKKPTTRTNT